MHRRINGKISVSHHFPKRQRDVVSQNIVTEGTYNHETDICQLHHYVLNQFIKEREKIEQWEKDISEINEFIKTTPMLVIQRNRLIKTREDLVKKIHLIKSKKNQDEYLSKVKDIITLYKQTINRRAGNISFGKQTKPSKELMHLISTYIGIASKYSDIDLIPEVEDNQDEKSTCSNCGSTSLQMDEGWTCKECGTHVNSVSMHISFGDLTHTGGNSRNSYLNKENFLKAMIIYQGKQTDVEFSKEMIDDIDNYCQEQQIDKYKLTPPEMRSIFQHKQYPFYDHVNLFLSQYNGRPCPDISEYESLFLQDYNQFTQEYERCKEDRSSALNSQYLLLKFHQKRKVPYDIDNFKIPNTDTIARSNDKTTRKIFKILGWKFTDTI